GAARRPRPTRPWAGAAGTRCRSSSGSGRRRRRRSEEHTSELQSRFDLVCRLLLEKKNDAERKKRDEIEAGKSYCIRRFGGATCDDKSAQIYARVDKNDWRIQPAEFYRFHDAEVNTFGYF